MKPGVDLARARADMASMAATTAAQYPDDERGLERHRAAADRRIHSRRRAAGAADDDGRGDAGVADRVRECRQPDAGARIGTAARVFGEGRARCRPRAHGEAAADRMRVARPCLGAARHRASPTSACGCSTARSLRVTCPTTSTGRSAAASLPTRSPISALTGLVFGLAPALQAGRLNIQEVLRDGARGSGQSGRRARASQWPGDRRSGALARAARRRVAVRSQLSQHAERESRLRYVAAADAPVLHDRRRLRGGRAQVAARRRHRAADRRAAGSAVGVRIELHSARRGRRRRQRHRRRPRRARKAKSRSSASSA